MIRGDDCRAPRTGPCTRARRLALACAAALCACACGAGSAPQGVPAPGASAASPAYVQRAPGAEGTGKFYMGREIAWVMGHEGAGWLERDGRTREERTDLLLDNLPLAADSVVADIGAGTGYFSLPIAARVPRGKVLAVDIQPEMLDVVARRRAAAGLANIETVLAAEDDPRLPAGSVDLALLVDAYHEFAYPREVMRRLVAALRPGGKLVLVEYRGEDPAVPIRPLHKMTEAQARAEMAAAGLEWLETRDFLPQQHFMVFARPAAAGESPD